jgi:2-phospho-L-lactate guanylyltransferase
MDIAMVCDFAVNDASCIVISPSIRYDGTNLLLRKPPKIMGTHFDNNSYVTHIETAKDLGIPIKLFFSKSLMSDVDTPEDIKQIAKETGGISKTIDFLKQMAGKF